MDSRTNKTPLRLARDYFNGLLSFDDYREQRRRLVNDITRVDATRPMAVTAVSEDSTDVTQEIPPRQPVAADAVAEKSAGKWLLPGVAVVVVCIVAAWFLLPGGHEDPAATDEQRVTHDTGGSDPVEAVPVISVLDEFLVLNDWSYKALEDLALAWSAMPEQDQQTARGAPVFRVFSERLKERVLEQRALVDIDGEAAGREKVLLSLAAHLGVAGIDYVDSTVAMANEASEQEAVQNVAPQPAAGEQPGKTAVDTAPLAAQVVEADTPAQQLKQQPETIKPPAVVVVDEVAAEPAPAAIPAAVIEPAAATVETTVADSATAAVAVPVRKPEVADRKISGDACPASLAKTRKPYCSDVLNDGSKGPVMVVLPEGNFRMGSEHESSEQPVHDVHIERPFAIAVYEVSVADYLLFCKASGRHCAPAWKGEKDPAVNVSWKDADSYSNWLSSVTGMTYRLPTEAEWEYAARGGTTTDYPFKDGDKVLPSDARFNASSPLPVDDRSVNTNRYKLRHIVGNVREWVADAWFEDYQGVPAGGRARTSSAIKQRVVRGGSFADMPYKLRTASRESLMFDARDNKTGFRLVREIKN